MLDVIFKMCAISHAVFCCEIVCRTILSAHTMNAAEWILQIGDFASVAD